MDLTLSADQQALVEATHNWCADHLTPDAIRKPLPHLWSDMQAMGWAGMTGPDIGLDHATEALVFAELGRFLAPVGLLSSAAAGRWFDEQGKTALLVPDGDQARVLDTDGASQALGVVDDALMLTILPNLGAQASLDPGTSLAHMALGTPHAVSSHPNAMLHFQLLSAAYAVGCADQSCRMAADYALLRQQFDRPIGWFQALKHICADMCVRVEAARSQLIYAACALDADDPDRHIWISGAKLLADQAALANARANIQVHGGIGMTDEAQPHLYLKRAHLLAFVAPSMRPAY